MDSLLTGMFAQPPGMHVTLSDFLLRLLVAYLAGQAIGWFYAWSHGVLSYSQNLVQSLVLLSMVVCVIMGVVGDSLARAFGPETGARGHFTYQAEDRASHEAWVTATLDRWGRIDGLVNNAGVGGRFTIEQGDEAELASAWATAAAGVKQSL